MNAIPVAKSLDGRANWMNMKNIICIIGHDIQQIVKSLLWCQRLSPSNINKGFEVYCELIHIYNLVYSIPLWMSKNNKRKWKKLELSSTFLEWLYIWPICIQISQQPICTFKTVNTSFAWFLSASLFTLTLWLFFTWDIWCSKRNRSRQLAYIHIMYYGSCLESSWFP